MLLQTVEEDGSRKDHEWQQISCGMMHTVGITPDGHICSWGCGKNGQLGHHEEDEDHSVDQPKRIDNKLFMDLFSRKVNQVSCGLEHTAVVTTEGELYTWYVVRFI